MPKRSSKEDINETASRIARQTTEPSNDRIGAVLMELEQRLTPKELRQLAGAILGRKGGKAGGKARAQKLSPQQRSQIAKKAAQARWKKE